MVRKAQLLSVFSAALTLLALPNFPAVCCPSPWFSRPPSQPTQPTHTAQPNLRTSGPSLPSTNSGSVHSFDSVQPACKRAGLRGGRGRAEGHQLTSRCRCQSHPTEPSRCSHTSRRTRCTALCPSRSRSLCCAGGQGAGRSGHVSLDDAAVAPSPPSSYAHLCHHALFVVAEGAGELLGLQSTQGEGRGHAERASRTSLGATFLGGGLLLFFFPPIGC